MKGPHEDLEDPRANAAREYLHSFVNPLLDESDRPGMVIEYDMAPTGLHSFVVKVPSGSVRFLVGKGGANAEVIRTVMKMWSAANRCRIRIDVAIRSL